MEAGEREREIERARRMESEKDAERKKERGRKSVFETQKELFCTRTNKKQLCLRRSKAKDSYFGVSEATLFETVFETEKTIKKTKKVLF